MPERLFDSDTGCHPDASGEETAFIRLSGRVGTALRDHAAYARWQ